MSITIKATGSDGGSVNLTVQSGIGPVGPNAVLLGGTGIDVTYANGEATLDVNATLATLTDVSAAAPSAGQVLEWDGSQWAPGTDTTLNLASATPSNLGTAAAGTGTAAARDDHVHAMPALGDLTDVTLSSPSAGEVLTWNGTAWTAAADSSDFTGYATETYVDSAVANLVDSSPATLDTLNELAAALGDDGNFAANVTASLAGKADANHSHVKANITDLTTSDLDMGGNRVLFGNVYSTLGDLPDASTYHGMFAHVHAEGAAYYAHAGNWVELADRADVPSNIADLADVSGSPSTNQALLYNGTQWQPGNIPAGTTINTLSGDLTLANGTGITLDTSGSTLTLSAALPPSNIGDLADVSADSPSVDQILVYNGSAWEAKNNSGGTTVNTLAGAVTLVAGGNVAISESGQTITISATASGLQGADGADGINGTDGADGADGAAANLTLGDITTLTAGTAATATLTGTAPDFTLNFGLPAGDTGPQGAAGPTTNLTIGTVTTGAAGSNATATIVGTPPDLTLNLTIPQGDTGAAGANGTSGMSLGLFFALS